MSRLRRFQIIEPSPPSSFFLRETSILAPKTVALNPLFPSFAIDDRDELDLAFDLFSPPKPCPITSRSFFDFDTVADLIQIETTPFFTTSTRKVLQTQRVRTTESAYLQSLCDRVSALELSYDRMANAKPHHAGGGDRKYTWTAEIESPERKYKWTAEIRGGAKKKIKGKVEAVEPPAKVEKRYKWTAEIKGKEGEEAAPVTRTYTFKASSGGKSEKKEKKKEEVVEKEERKTKCDKKSHVGTAARIVEIEEPSDHGVIVLRQAFAKRVARRKGKKKELSPQDAAMMIQISFRAYLIRRSKALRALRELAIAKTKLKEIRALFNNFTYRRRLTRDAEEHQRFTERIIVLLLTVDAIEGADVMVRASKRSMVDELEAMLDVVDPKPQGRSLSMRRRTFDMPDALIQKELAESVAQVVQMLDEEQ